MSHHVEIVQDVRPSRRHVSQQIGQNRRDRRHEAKQKRRALSQCVRLKTWPSCPGQREVSRGEGVHDPVAQAIGGSVRSTENGVE
jgi:hypothetical protein